MLDYVAVALVTGAGLELARPLLVWRRPITDGRRAHPIALARLRRLSDASPRPGVACLWRLRGFACNSRIASHPTAMGPASATR
jgi:hypothetical protein